MNNGENINVFDTNLTLINKINEWQKYHQTDPNATTIFEKKMAGLSLVGGIRFN